MRHPHHRRSGIGAKSHVRKPVADVGRRFMTSVVPKSDEQSATSTPTTSALTTKGYER